MLQSSTEGTIFLRLVFHSLQGTVPSVPEVVGSMEAGIIDAVVEDDAVEDDEEAANDSIMSFNSSCGDNTG